MGGIAGGSRARALLNGPVQVDGDRGRAALCAQRTCCDRYGFSEPGGAGVQAPLPLAELLLARRRIDRTHAEASIFLGRAA